MSATDVFTEARTPREKGLTPPESTAGPSDGGGGSVTVEAMSTLVLGGSAVIPSLLLLWYVYARDRNPEPRGLLLKTFLLGAAICAPVIPVAMG